MKSIATYFTNNNYDSATTVDQAGWLAAVSSGRFA